MPARAESPLVVPIEGEPFRAELTAVDAAWRLTLMADKKPRTLSVADLVAWGQCVEQGRGGALILADGGILAAECLAADKEKLTIASETFGAQKLPIESLCGVVFRPPSDRQKRDALFDRIARAIGESDRLLLDNGDELTGLLAGIENDVAKLDAEVGHVEVATDRIVAIIFNPALTRKPPPAGNSLRAWAGFRDGSRLLAAEIILHDASLRIVADGLTWNAPPDRLVFLQPLGGRAVYLSDLKPAEYHQVPYLDLPWPYQADRNVTGGWLRCAGRLYLKGIGVHSTAQMVYTLDQEHSPLPQAGEGQQTKSPRPLGEGQGVRAAGSVITGQGPVANGQQATPTRFCADLAIDDSTAGQGSVQFHVLVDGQEKFTSKIIRGGDAPVPVSMDLTGAKKLELLVDYADRGDVLDHADWLNARLVKSGETTNEHR